MGFLAKAAAFVLTVLSSVFTNIEQPKQTPAVAPMRTTTFVKAEVPDAPSIAIPGGTIVVTIHEPPVDPANERFIALIKSAPAPKAIHHGQPWFVKFASPESSAVIQVFTGEKSLNR